MKSTDPMPPLALRTLLAAGPLLLAATAASAYVGPGAGITAIGTVFALIGAAVLAIVGFVWYPIKRLFLGKKPAKHPSETTSPTRDA